MTQSALTREDVLGAFNGIAMSKREFDTLTELADRLSPAPEPEVDEATRVWREMPAYRTDAQISYLREVLAAKDAEKAHTIALLTEERDHEIARHDEWKKRALDWQDKWQKAESELAALRAENERLDASSENYKKLYAEYWGKAAVWYSENERLKADCARLQQALAIQEGVSDTVHEALWAAGKAAERNTAEPAKTHGPGPWPGDPDHRETTPGTNAGAVEVTQAGAKSAQIYADFHCEDGSFNITCAERLAAEFDKVRTEAEARGRRDALEKLGDLADERWAGTREGAALRGLLIELKRLMTGGK